MTGPRRWSRVGREPIAQCRVFDVARIRSRSPRTGREHDFYAIEAPDWVNVIPVTPDDRVVMVRQFRHGADDLTLETPGGMVDPGETAALAGARELVEETGYRAERWRSLGGVNPNPALFGNRLHVFLAEGARRVAEIENGDGTEETAVELVPRSELPARIAAGEVDHALVVAALALYAVNPEGASRPEE